MAYRLPVIRSVGTNAVGTTSATPGLPAGTVEGDLLLTVVASGGEAGDVAQSGFNIIRAVKNGTAATDSQLTILWKIAGASESATQVTSTTNHVSCRTICIQRGTFNSLNPIHAESGGNTQTSTTSVSISGLVTTKDNCLILSFAGASLPDAASTAQFASWANASLTSLNEETDDNTSQGNGGGHGTLSGVKATAGTVSATTATKASSALMANLMVAIEPITFIPTLAEFGEYRTVIDGADSGWDQFFENTGAIIKFGSTYFMYFIGGDDDADIGDDFVYNRKLGVATSPDGVNWTKYGSNPIVTFAPSSNYEEGVGNAVAVVYGGEIHLFYSALRYQGSPDVDVEIRYRVSTDGFTFTDDTLVKAVSTEEYYALACYVTSGGTFNLYYVGPLTSGVGDMKRLTGTDPTSLSDAGTVTTADFSGNGNMIELDADTLLLTADRTFAGVASQYAVSKSALGTLGPLVQQMNFGSALQLSYQILKDGDQWYLYHLIGTSISAPFDATQIVMRAYPPLPEFTLSPSSDIAASAATNTTAQLSAPSGKTTSDFEAGKISDDTNPLPSLNLSADKYTEAEICMEGTDVAGAGEVYEFRWTNNGTPLDTYTEYPEITIAADGVEGTASLSGSGTCAAGGSKQVIGSGAASTSGAMQASGTKGAAGAASLSGSGAISASGQKHAAQSAALSGSGAIAASGSALESHVGSASISGSGQLQSTGAKSVYGTSVITGSGLIVTTSDKGASHVAALSGSGAISTLGSAVESHSGSASLSASGSLQANGTKGAHAQSGLSGSGALTTVGMKAASGVASLSCAGSLQASGGAAESHSGTAEVSGSGSLAASGAKAAMGRASLSSAAQLSAMGLKHVGGTVSLSGGGTPSGSVSKHVAGAAALSGWGSLSAFGSQVVYGNVLLRTNERLRVPGATNERLRVPGVASERLRVPGIFNETLTKG